MGAWKVFCKSNKCSEELSHLSSPNKLTLSSHNLYIYYLYDYISVCPYILDVKLEGKEANVHLIAEI